MDTTVCRVFAGRARQAVLRIEHALHFGNEVERCRRHQVQRNREGRLVPPLSQVFDGGITPF